MLHANLGSLLRSRVCIDEDAAEETEQRCPEDEENPVPAEGPVGLKEWQAVDKDGEGAEGTDDFRVDPLSIGVGVVLLRLV